MVPAKETVAPLLVNIKAAAPRHQQIHAFLAGVLETLDVGLPSRVLVNLVQNHERPLPRTLRPECIEESIRRADKLAAPLEIVPAPVKIFRFSFREHDLGEGRFPDLARPHHERDSPMREMREIEEPFERSLHMTIFYYRGRMS